MRSSRKNPYPPHGRSSEIPRGRGVFKVKILEAKYEAKLEFPGEIEGAKQKTFCGEAWIFSGTAQHLGEGTRGPASPFPLFQGEKGGLCGVGKGDMRALED